MCLIFVNMQHRQPGGRSRAPGGNFPFAPAFAVASSNRLIVMRAWPEVYPTAASALTGDGGPSLSKPAQLTTLAASSSAIGDRSTPPQPPPAQPALPNGSPKGEEATGLPLAAPVAGGEPTAERATEPHSEPPLPPARPGEALGAAEWCDEASSFVPPLFAEGAGDAETTPRSEPCACSRAEGTGEFTTPPFSHPSKRKNPKRFDELAQPTVPCSVLWTFTRVPLPTSTMKNSSPSRPSVNCSLSMDSSARKTTSRTQRTLRPGMSSCRRQGASWCRESSWSCDWAVTLTQPVSPVDCRSTFTRLPSPRSRIVTSSSRWQTPTSSASKASLALIFTNDSVTLPTAPAQKPSPGASYFNFTSSTPLPLVWLTHPTMLDGNTFTWIRRPPPRFRTTTSSPMERSRIFWLSMSSSARMTHGLLTSRVEPGMNPGSE
mmetsp:Transcript_53936/g.156690  ORF Transcript_53936/g.156690 Transcript_53936/m.156690 type:complete len:433 (+) Transcript_53936:144-1442(+)